MPPLQQSIRKAFKCNIIRQLTVTYESPNTRACDKSKTASLNMLTISACLSVHSYALQIEAERNRTGSALINSFLYICMFQY